MSDWKLFWRKSAEEDCVHHPSPDLRKYASLYLKALAEIDQLRATAVARDAGIARVVGIARQDERRRCVEAVKKLMPRGYQTYGNAIWDVIQTLEGLNDN